MVLLRLDEVTKSYADGARSLAVLRGVSLEIDAGDFVGVYGKRRAGKTTLLRIMAGLERPDEGEVTFAGRSLSQPTGDDRTRVSRRRGISLVSSGWRPDRNTTAVDRVALPLLADGWSLRDAREMARLRLEDMGVGTLANTTTDRLSQGEHFRVLLAQAMARTPQLLLIDEPAVVHRPRELAEMCELVHELGDDGRIAVVVASEDLSVACGVRRLMGLSGGCIRSTDRDAEVLSFPDRRRAASDWGIA